MVGGGHSRVLVKPGDQVEVHYRVSNYSEHEWPDKLCVKAECEDFQVQIKNDKAFALKSNYCARLTFKLAINKHSLNTVRINFNFYNKNNLEDYIGFGNTFILDIDFV